MKKTDKKSADDAEQLHRRVIELEQSELKLKRTEGKLQEAQKMLQLVLDTIPVRVFWKDRELNYLGCNKKFAADAGLQSPREIIGRNDFDLTWKKQAELYRSDDMQVIQSGMQKINYVEPHTSPAGPNRWLRTSKVPLADMEGNILGVLGTYEDITEAKQAEEKLKNTNKELNAREQELSAVNQQLRASELQLRAANQQLEASFQQLKAGAQTLRESEERFRAIADNTPDAIITADSSSTIVYCNSAAEKVFGYTKDEMVGMSTSQFLPSRLREREQENKAAYMSSGFSSPFDSTIESMAVRKDGTEFPIEFSLSSWEVDGNFYFTTITRDITSKKRSDEVRSRLAAAIEQADEAVVMTDSDGVIEYVNPAFVKVTGYGRGEVIGKKPSILKSGKQSDAFYKNLWATITRGDVWKGHFINKLKNGTLYEEDAIITPLRDSQERIKSFVAVKRDVTRQMKLEQQYRQAQKMEAIGTLASGIAHDFNNILSVIYGYAQIGLDIAENGSKLSDCLSQIYTAAERAKELVKQILTFSRQTEQEKRPVQAGIIIKEVCKFLRASLPSTIELRLTIKTEQDYILGDPTQIHQILMNLCTNAHHAMKDTGGILEVILEQPQLTDEDLLLHSDLKQGDYVRLTVSDTGCGIEKENFDRIFDPYFTTRASGEGTGMGLAVAHGIIMDYGGEIKVYSEVGRGTKFDVYFPRMETQQQQSDREEGEQIIGGHETILFIDDEEFLVTAARTMLGGLGYTVITATSAEQALETFENNSSEFDLVITDKTLPHITGFTIVQTMKIIRKDIPVILCTGFKEQEDDARARDLGINAVLIKPVRKKVMAETIRSVLDR